MTLSAGAGRLHWSATMFFFAHAQCLYATVGESDEIVKGVRQSSWASFAIDKGKPEVWVQGRGRVAILGPLDARPDLKEAFTSKLPFLTGFWEASRKPLVWLEIRPDAYWVTDVKSGQGREVFATDLPRVSPLRAGLRALRVVSFTAAVIPVALGAVLSIGARESRWVYLPLVVLAALLLQAGTNVINDVVDYRKGVDTPLNFGHSGVFVEGSMSARAGHAYGIALFGAAALIGVALAVLRGPGVLAFGAVGLVGGYLYTGGPKGYKYLALGDIAVFFLMGPLMVIGTSYVITGEVWLWRVVWASLPVGFLVAAILEANNLRDLDTDRQAGVRTVAGLLGFDGAKAEYVMSVAAAYVIVVALAVTRVTSWWSLLVMATLPISVPLVRVVLSAPRPGSRRLGLAMVRTAMLHMAFGAALVVGLAVGAALA